MSEIYMVRHGQASFGKDNYDVLSERGMRQSEILAEYLFGMSVDFDAVYSGTLDRQKKSAAVFIEYYRSHGRTMPEPVILEGFNEYDSRSIIECQLPEMLKEDPSLEENLKSFFTDRKSFQRLFERAMLRWVSGKYSYQGMERWTEFQERVGLVIDAVMKEQGGGKRILIFASGGSISAAVQYAAKLPDEETLQLCWQMVNSSVTRFRYNGGRITLSVFNSYPHLEMKGDKGLITYR